MKITFRIWLLIIVVALSLISVLGIPPQFLQNGLTVKSVTMNSTIYNDGLRAGMIIKSVNGKKISSMKDYESAMSPVRSLSGNQTLRIDIKTANRDFVNLYTSNITKAIALSSLSSTKIKTGLDLTGGARAFVNASVPLDDSQMDDLIAVSEQRLNVYGLSDAKFFKIKTSDGQNLMEIEIAGATPDDLKDLITKQGHFEAKIGNQTVFVGGHKDITHVGRTGQSAVITDCNPTKAGGEYCNFRFTIFLSEAAAQRQADLTGNLSINGSYLSKKLDLYTDGKLIDSLNIGTSLRGAVETQISISGSGKGANQKEALANAKKNMKKLQTILITGSLPYKLHILKMDTISPNLGKQFIRQIILGGIFAFLAVSIVVFVRYRKMKVSLAMIMTSSSEILIILGVACLIGWNLDLPSIAGIIASIGTGLDDQIVILDEAKYKYGSIIQRIKNALFIIVTSFATTFVAMLPLTGTLGFMGITAAGAGLLKGFAITTIIGITAGVFIARPAFADIVKQIEN